MQVHVFAVFVVALVIAVATPGPGIFAVVSCALGRGLRDAVAMAWGIAVGDLIYFSLAVLGLAALAHSMGHLFFIVKLIGAAYLVWLGIKLWRRAKEVSVVASAAPNRSGFCRGMAAGLAVTLGNPKAMIFYAGLLPTVLDLDQLSPHEAFAMGMVVVVVVGSVMTLYALAATRARQFLGSSQKIKFMNRTAGTMMIGAGVAVAVR